MRRTIIEKTDTNPFFLRFWADDAGTWACFEVGKTGTDDYGWPRYNNVWCHLNPRWWRVWWFGGWRPVAGALVKATQHRQRRVDAYLHAQHTTAQVSSVCDEIAQVIQAELGQ